MNAAGYRRWATPLLDGRPSAAAEAFLSLPARWEAAAGRGHFLESSLASRRPETLKLALILDAPPGPLLAAKERDEPRKAAAAAALIESVRSLGGRHDAQAAALALELLRSWRLRGSLMLSCDFDRNAGAFGKLSLYAYLPRPAAAAELLEALGAAPAPGGAAMAGDDLEFWGLDLWPDGERSLKLYHRAPYAPGSVPEGLRRFAQAVSELAEIRDVTRLTRLPSPGAAARGGSDKVYLGLKDGLDLDRLARLPPPTPRAGFFRELAALAPGQRAYFIGLDGADVEVYFDRRVPAPERAGVHDG